MLIVAFYDDEKTNESVSIEVAWSELATMLTTSTPSLCTSNTCTGKKCPYKSNSTEDDAGAWSPVIINGLRSNANVEAVTALVLDGDGLSVDQLQFVSSRLVGRQFIVHTTHRHRADGINFIRLVLALSRPVQSVEWTIFYSKAINYLGFTGIFDDLKDLSRLYFFPTHPNDVQFLSDTGEGDLLDVDLILQEQKDTTVTTTLTTVIDIDDISNDASTESYSDFGTVITQLRAYRQSRARGDTLDKERADLIGKLLAGKPLAAPGGNADITPIKPPIDLPKGRGYAIMRTASILTGYLAVDTPDWIYLDLFRNSITAMCFGREADRSELEQQLLEKVRLGRERRRVWDEEAIKRNTVAKTFQAALIEERKQKRETVTSDEEDIDWMSKLQVKGDTIINSAFNVYSILKNANELRGIFRWDDVNLCIVSSGMFATVEPEVLADTVANYLALKWGVNFNNAIIVLRQILIVAYENRFDPIRDYLRGLIWDGVLRINADGGWLTKYANVKSTPFTIKVGRKWLVGSVARGLNPGCKHDCVLILEGLQGKRKSTLFRIMGGEFYAAVSLTVADKDSKMVAARSWIAELPDLAALKKVSEINALKAFFSTEEDTFRPPYGRTVIKSKRRNSFAGTTNEDSYLVDPTGNRRYLTVSSMGMIDIDAVIRDRDQIWAEAVYLYDKHVNECQDKLICGCWWFSENEADEAEEEAKERVQESPIKMMIQEWWEILPPEVRLKEFTTLFIAKIVLEYTPDKINENVLTRIGIAVMSLGFKKCRRRIENNGIKTRSWVYVATDELLAMPQSEAGKRMKFKVIKGGVEDKKIEKKIEEKLISPVDSTLEPENVDDAR